MAEKLEQIEEEFSVPPANVLTVSQLNSYISETIKSDPDLRTVYSVPHKASSLIPVEA